MAEPEVELVQDAVVQPGLRHGSLWEQLRKCQRCCSQQHWLWGVFLPRLRAQNSAIWRVDCAVG